MAFISYGTMRFCSSNTHVQRPTDNASLPRVKTPIFRYAGNPPDGPQQHSPRSSALQVPRSFPVLSHIDIINKAGAAAAAAAASQALEQQLPGLLQQVRLFLVS
jgi:hypothetical protein